MRVCVLALLTPPQFAAEMSFQAAGLGRKPEPVAVLTARAREFRSFLEIRPTDKLCVGFRARGEARGYPEWGVGPVLYGSVAEWICQERKGWRKYDNFRLLRANRAPPAATTAGTVRPRSSVPLADTDATSGRSTRRRYVFVGDNGKSEKDLQAAQFIIDEFPNDLDAVFLHAVSSTEQPAPLPADEEYGGVPIRYYRTYATAAAKANALGLLSGAAAHRVLDGAEADMAADTINLAPGSANEQLLRAEIAAAREAVGGGGLGKPLGPLRRPLRRLQPLTKLRRAAGAVPGVRALVNRDASAGVLR